MIVYFAYDLEIYLLVYYVYYVYAVCILFISYHITLIYSFV